MQTLLPAILIIGFFTLFTGWLFNRLFAAMFAFFSSVLYGATLFVLDRTSTEVAGDTLALFATLSTLLGISLTIVASIYWESYRDKKLLREMRKSPANPTGDLRLHLAQMMGVTPDAVNLDFNRRWSFPRPSRVYLALAGIGIGLGAIGYFLGITDAGDAWMPLYYLALLTLGAVNSTYTLGLVLWYVRVIKGPVRETPTAPDARPTLTLVHDRAKADEKHPKKP